ncbi:MAG: hypothetical protein R3B93_18395 [Bacteroidia bacterium]
MPITAKERINILLHKVNDVSYQERIRAVELEEQRINTYLDGINKLKELLKEQINNLNILIEECEKLTWLERKDLDEDALKSISGLIAFLTDIHNSSIHNYKIFSDFADKTNIAHSEIQGLKTALDDLKESINDLETVFFKNPNSAVESQINDLLNSI